MEKLNKSSISAMMKEFILRCLQEKPENRYSFQDLLTHKIFEKVRKGENKNDEEVKIVKKKEEYGNSLLSKEEAQFRKLRQECSKKFEIAVD